MLYPGMTTRAGGLANVKSESKSTTAETAEYIGGIARELRSLASQADLGFLAYLLSMVEQEAAETSSRKGPTGAKPEGG